MSTNLQPRRALLALLIYLLASRVAFASTVLDVDMDVLLGTAALVMEAEIISREARWNQDQTYITTYVTFKVKDVIKGKRPSTMITLAFAGGTVGNISLKVEGMVYPGVGEKGIYFFENPGQRLVNPMVGWSQGHFLLEMDSSGVERILTEGGAPVIAVEAVSSQTPKFANRVNAPFSRAVARGIRTGKASDKIAAALSKSQFKGLLRDRLAAKK